MRTLLEQIPPMYLLPILLGWAVVSSSCELLDSPEPLPIYLELRQAEIVLDTNSGFADTTGLKDLWIDHNGFSVGVHRLPRIIPLIPQESNRLTLSGGVFETGLSSLRARYPFWRPITVDLEAEPLDTVTFDLSFEYWPDTMLIFPFEENFEGASTSFISTTLGNNRTTLRTSSRDVFQGNGAGLVNFDGDSYNFEAIAADFIALPQTGSNDIYLEITYKNDIPFTAGLLYATVAGTDIGDLNSNLVFYSPEDWNTVYIHVNDQVRGVAGTAFFKPYLRATSLDNASGEIQNGSLLIDNIRLIHFK